MSNPAVRRLPNHAAWVMGLLAVVFILSAILQFDLLEGYKKIALSAMSDLSARDLPKAQIIIEIFKSLTILDWSVLIGLVICGVALFIMQLRYKLLGQFLDYVLASGWRTAAWMAFILALFLKPVLAGGEPFFMDAPSHVSRAWFTYLNFKQGYWFPSYTNYYHNGFALFSHYGFLFSVLGGGLNLIVNDINTSVKILILGLSGLNAWLFYRLGWRLFGNRRGACLLAMTISISNIYAYLLMWSGALFFPLILLGTALLWLGFESLAAKKLSLWRASFITAIGILILAATHLGYTAQILVLFAVWVLSRLIVHYRRDLGRFIGWMGISALLTGLFCAFVYLPTVFDLPDVNFYKAFPFSDPSTYQFWKVPFWQMLIPRPFYSDNLDYLGLALVLTCLVGLIFYFRRPNGWLVVHLSTLVLAIIVQGYSRNSLLLFFSLALFLPKAVDLIANRQPNRLSPRREHFWYGTIVLLLLTDSLICNNYNTYNQDNGFEHQFYNRLAAEPYGQSLGVVKANSLHTGNQPTNNVFVSPWLKVVGHQVVQPNAIMLEANKQALYQFGITNDLLIRDIQNQTIADSTAQALALIGVRYLSFHHSSAYFVPNLVANPNFTINQNGPWVELPGSQPLFFSQKIASLADVAPQLVADQKQFEADDRSHASAPFNYRVEAGHYLNSLTTLTNLHVSTGLADQFVLRRGPHLDWSTSQAAKLNIQSFALDSQTITAGFSVSQPGFIYLPFAYFPYQQVSLNGRPVSFWPSAMNMLVIPVDKAGSYNLHIGPSISPARRLGAIISLGSLGGSALVWAVVAVLRRRRPA